MQIFFIIFKHEILLSFRHSEKILANFLFFLISVAVFFLLSQNQDLQGSGYFYPVTIIWFSLLSCLIFGAAEFLKKDFDDGSIEQIMLSCEHFEIFTFAKMLSNWLVNCLPILVCAPLILLAGGFEKVFTLNFFLLFLPASLAINFICSFCGSLSVLGNSAPIIAVISLPLVIPVLLIAYGALAGDFATGMKILCGLTILFGAISTLATAKIVKIASE